MFLLRTNDVTMFLLRTNDVFAEDKRLFPARQLLPPPPLTMCMKILLRTNDDRAECKSVVGCLTPCPLLFRLID